MIESTDLSEVRTGGNTGAVGQATQQGSGIAVGSKATGGVGGGDERSVHFQAGTNLQATGSKEDMIKVSQNKKRILNEYKNKNKTKYNDFQDGGTIRGKSVRTQPKSVDSPKSHVQLPRKDNPTNNDTLVGLTPLRSSTPKAAASAKVEPTKPEVSTKGGVKLSIAEKESNSLSKVENENEMEDLDSSGELTNLMKDFDHTYLGNDGLSDTDKSMDEDVIVESTTISREGGSKGFKEREGNKGVRASKGDGRGINKHIEVNSVKGKKNGKDCVEGGADRGEGAGDNPPVGKTYADATNPNSIQVPEAEKRKPSKRKQEDKNGGGGGNDGPKKPKKLFSKLLEEGDKVEIRADKAWVALDQVDFNMVEIFISDEYIDLENPGFDLISDIVDKGKSQGGLWFITKNELCRQFITDRAPKAPIPEGRSGYKYKVYGPNERPYRYFLLNGIKKELWRPAARMELLLRKLNRHLDYEVTEEDGNKRRTHLRVSEGCQNFQAEVPKGKKSFNITLEADEFLVKDILAVQNGQMLVGAFSKIKVLGGGIERERKRLQEEEVARAQAQEGEMVEPGTVEDNQAGGERPQVQPQARVEDPPADEEATSMEQADFSC